MKNRPIFKHAGHESQASHRSNYGKGLVVVRDYVNLIGPASYDRHAPIIDLLVRDDPNTPVYFQQDIQKTIQHHFNPRMTGRPARLLFNPDGYVGPHLPVFDLVLRPSTGETQLQKSAVLQELMGSTDLSSEGMHYRAELSPISIAKSNDEKRYTFGVVYKASTDEGTEKDAHGDYATADDLQQAQWDYVKTGDRSIFVQHKRPPFGFQKAGEWVEITTLPFEVSGDFKFSDGKVEKRAIPAGSTWMGVQWEPWAWDLVKSGKITGYSFGGRAQRFTND